MGLKNVLINFLMREKRKENKFMLRILIIIVLYFLIVLSWDSNWLVRIGVG